MFRLLQYCFSSFHCLEKINCSHFIFSSSSSCCDANCCNAFSSRCFNSSFHSYQGFPLLICLSKLYRAKSSNHSFSFCLKFSKSELECCALPSLYDCHALENNSFFTLAASL